MSYSSPLAESRPRTPAGRNDLFALARALVFTREAYRTLQTKATPRPTPPAGHPAPFLQVAGRPESFPIAAARPERPLTPWDLMDDHDSPEGVAFATFQRRPHHVRLAQDAA